jgi:outer membrane lipoprotein LolB
VIRARTGLRAAASVAVVLLAACTAIPFGSPPLSGRLVLRVGASDTTSAQGFQAAFDLWGDAQRGRLDLSTPLGPRIASASWEAGMAQLDDGREQRLYPDLQTLAQQVFGQPLPLQALPDWLHGRPWSGAEHARTSEGFAQLGWQVDTSARDQGLIVAHRDTLGPATPAVTLRVRVTPTGP